MVDNGKDKYLKEMKEMSEFVAREEFLKKTTEKTMFNEIKRLVNIYNN